MCSVVLEMRHADEWADPAYPVYLISCSALLVRNCNILFKNENFYSEIV